MEKPIDARPHFIYVLKEDGEIRYVGQTVGKLCNRLSRHIRDKNTGDHRGNWIKSLTSKGLKPTIELIEVVPPGKDWRIREMFWIAYYREIGYDLTNSTDGGEGQTGRVTSEETKEKLRLAGTGRVFSEETKKKLSESNKGKVFSVETKEKMRQAKLGKKKSAEHIERIRQSRIGVPLTAEHRANISKGNIGRVPSLRAIEAMRQSRAKPVVQYTLEGGFVRLWDCANTVERELEIDSSSIGHCANKHDGYIRAGDFQWRYYSETLGADIEPVILPVRGKPVLQYTIYGEFIKEWQSARIAGNELKILPSNIRECCREKINTAGGFIWRIKNARSQ